MLKIKDDVDLKELEKFGFKDYKLFMYKKIQEDDNTFFGLHIEKRNRLISIDYQASYEPIYKDILYDMNILYDIIQADLVEKVQEA